MPINLTDEQLGARLAAMLNANLHPKRNEGGIRLAQDPEDEQMRHVVVVTDQFYDLTKVARAFREFLEPMIKPPRKKKAGAR